MRSRVWKNYGCWWGIYRPAQPYALAMSFNRWEFAVAYALTGSIWAGNEIPEDFLRSIG
jgi:hypothetical protein